MMITSCGGLLLVAVGLVSLKKKHHHSSLVTALLASLLVCVAVAAVVLVFLLRANIEHDINKVNVEAELRTAVAEEARMELWDSLQARLVLQLVVCSTATSASKSSIQRFEITEKAPTRAFSWLKAATTAFTFKTLLRHYAKRALTPRSLNVKLGLRCNYHNGWAAITQRHFSQWILV